MLKEFSYGAVIYKMFNAEPVFLLVKSNRSGRWGFPKGHTEKGENGIETAKREIFEETGIKDIVFIEGFREEDIYMIEGTLPETKGKETEKHSIYFLANALSEPSGSDQSEISEIKWCSIEEAVNILPFNNQQKVIKSAYKIIKKIGGENV